MDYSGGSSNLPSERSSLVGDAMNETQPKTPARVGELSNIGTYIDLGGMGVSSSSRFNTPMEFKGASRPSQVEAKNQSILYEDEDEDEDEDDIIETIHVIRESRNLDKDQEDNEAERLSVHSSQRPPSQVTGSNLASLSVIGDFDVDGEEISELLVSLGIGNEPAANMPKKYAKLMESYTQVGLVCDTLTAKLKALELEKEHREGQLSDQIAQLQHRVSELESENKILAEQASLKSDPSSGLEQVLTAKDKEIRYLEEKLAALVQEKVKSDAKMSSMERILHSAGLQSNRADAFEKILAVKEAASGHEYVDGDDVEGDEEQDAQFTLKPKPAFQSFELAQKQNEIDELLEKIISFEDQIDDMRAMNENLQSRNQAIDAERNQLKEDLLTSRNKIKEMEKELQSFIQSEGKALSSLSTELQSEYHRLQEENSRLKAQLEIHKIEKEELESRIHIYQTQIASETGKLEAKSGELIESKHMVHQLEAELSDLRDSQLLAEYGFNRKYSANSIESDATNASQEQEYEKGRKTMSHISSIGSSSTPVIENVELGSSPRFYRREKEDDGAGALMTDTSVFSITETEMLDKIHELETALNSHARENKDLKTTIEIMKVDRELEKETYIHEIDRLRIQVDTSPPASARSNPSQLIGSTMSFQESYRLNQSDNSVAAMAPNSSFAPSQQRSSPSHVTYHAGVGNRAISPSHLSKSASLDPRTRFEILSQQQQELDILAGKMNQMSIQIENLLFDKHQLGIQLSRSEKELSLLKQSESDGRKELMEARRNIYESKLEMNKVLTKCQVLSTERDSLKQKLDDTSSALSLLTKDYRSLKARYEDMAIRSSSTEYSTAQYMEQIRDLAESLDQETANSDSLAENIQKYDSECKRLQQQVEELRGTQGSLLTELGQTKILVQDQEETFASLEKAHESLRKSYAQMCDELALTQQKLDEQSQLVVELEENLQESLGNNEEFIKKVEDLDGKYKFLIIEKESLSKLFSAEKALNEQLQVEFERSETQRKNLETELGQSTRKLSQANADIQSLEDEKENLEAENQILQTKQEEQSLLIKTLQFTVSEQSKQRETLQKMNEQYEKRVKTYSENLQEINGKYSLLAEAKEGLSKEKSAIESVSLTQRMEIEKLRDELLSLHDKLSKTEDTLETTQKSLEDEKSEHQKLQGSYQTLYDRHSAMAKEYERKKTEYSIAKLEYEEKVQSLQFDLLTVQSYRDTLQREADGIGSIIDKSVGALETLDILPHIQLSQSIVRELSVMSESDVESNPEEPLSDIELTLSELCSRWKLITRALQYERETILKLLVSALRDVHAIYSHQDASLILGGTPGSPVSTWRQNPIVRELALPRTIPELTVFLIEQIRKLKALQSNQDENISELENRVAILVSELDMKTKVIESKQLALDYSESNCEQYKDQISSLNKELTVAYTDIDELHRNLDRLGEENEVHRQMENRYIQSRKSWEQERTLLLHERDQLRDLVTFPRDVRSTDFILGNAYSEAKKIWEAQRNSLYLEVDNLRSLLRLRGDDLAHLKSMQMETSAVQYPESNSVNGTGKRAESLRKMKSIDPSLPETKEPFERVVYRPKPRKESDLSQSLNASHNTSGNPSHQSWFGLSEPTKEMDNSSALEFIISRKAELEHLLQEIITFLPAVQVILDDSTDLQEVESLFKNYFSELEMENESLQQEVYQLKELLYRQENSCASLIYQKNYLLSLFEKDDDLAQWSSGILPPVPEPSYSFPEGANRNTRRITFRVAGFVFMAAIRIRKLNSLSNEHLQKLSSYSPAHSIIEELKRVNTEKESEMYQLRQELRRIEIEGRQEIREQVVKSSQVAHEQSGILEKEREQRLLLQVRVAKLEQTAAGNDVLVQSLRKQLGENAKTIAVLKEENRILAEARAKEVPTPNKRDKPERDSNILKSDYETLIASSRSSSLMQSGLSTQRSVNSNLTARLDEANLRPYGYKAPEREPLSRNPLGKGQ